MKRCLCAVVVLALAGSAGAAVLVDVGFEENNVDGYLNNGTLGGTLTKVGAPSASSDTSPNTAGDYSVIYGAAGCHYLNDSVASAIITSKALTVAAWIKWDGGAGLETIAGQWGAADKSGFLFGVNNGNLQLTVGAGTAGAAIAAGAVTANRWSCVAVTFDDTSNAYVFYAGTTAADFAEVASGTLNGAIGMPGTAQFAIGASNDSNANSYAGDNIDNVLVCDEALPLSGLRAAMMFSPSVELMIVH